MISKVPLREAFSLLVRELKWYQDSGVDPRIANRDKKKFLETGHIPEARMRMYLTAAGWNCDQPEIWSKSTQKNGE